MIRSAALCFSAIVLAACSGSDGDTSGAESRSKGFGPPDPALTVKEMKAVAQQVTNSGLTDYATLQEMEVILSFAGIDYEEISGDNGSFTLHSVGTPKLTVDKVSVTGLAADSDTSAFFDTILLEGFEIDEDAMGMGLTAERVYYNPPTKAEFFEMLETVDFDEIERDPDPLSPYNLSPQLALGSGYVEGLVIEEMTIIGEIGFIAWNQKDFGDDGDNPDHLSLLVKDMIMSFEDWDMDLIFDLNMESMSIRNMDVDYLEAGLSPNPFDRNDYKPYYDSFHYEKFSAGVDGFAIKLDQSAGWNTTAEDGVTYTYISKDPVLFGFEKDPESEAVQTFKATFDKMGYDPMRAYVDGVLSFDPKSDIVASQDYKIIVEDGMTLTMDYKIQGWGHLAETLKPMFDDMDDLGERMDMEDPALRSEINTAVEKLDIAQFDMTFTDQSLLERAFEAAADLQDIEVGDAREQAAGAAALVTMVAQTSYQSELGLSFANALGAFFEQGGEFKFSVSQDHSINAADVALDWLYEDDLDPMLKLLGMEFEHIPAKPQ